MSAAGIPQIALVFGNSTAGGAYVPGLSDYTVLVKHQAKVFLGGPPLVKMATGEEVDDEALGGAEMHTRVSGLGDYLAEDDADAIRIGREIVARLNWRKRYAAQLGAPEEPKYDPDELLGVIPADPRQPLDIREVIARLVDGSRFEEFKRDYGPTLVTGHAHHQRLPGRHPRQQRRPLLRIGHEGGAVHPTLQPVSRTPLIYLQNITGFMVGRSYEEEGIIKHGAKMINAVANSTVPQFTVIVGGSFGAGNYAHVWSHLRPDAALHLAQQPYRRDGRGTGGRRAGHRPGGCGAGAWHGAGSRADRDDAAGGAAEVRR